MKTLLFTLLAAMGVTAAQAQNVDHVTFKQLDGAEQTLAIDGLKITFAEGNLVATNGAETATIALSAMDKFYFVDPTSIQGVTVNKQQAEVSIVNGKLQVVAPEGSQVRVYGTDGRQVSPDNLTRGVYIVNVNGQSFKVLAK